MKSKIYLTLLWLVAGACLAAAETAAEKNAVQTLATAPLRFEPAPANTPGVFVARGARFHFEFTSHQAILGGRGSDIRLTFDGANASAHMQGTKLLHSTTNLYLGNDPAKWRRAIPNYGRLQVQGLYRGINLEYYGNGSELEYDLTISAGADPQQIRLRMNGTHLNRRGDLIAELIQKHPVAYQIAADGSRRLVASRYRKNAEGSYGFELGAYDPKRALVIDPVITVAQYFSGSYEDVAYGIGHDSKGLVYIGGNTFSPDLPLVGSSLQTSNAGVENLFFAVINPALSPSSQVIYVTYIGGEATDIFGAMSVGPNGDVYMTGSTTSGTFPQANAAQTSIMGTIGAADAFVLWLSPTQTLNYSTFFGGSNFDAGTAIAVDSSGKLWIGGDTQSTDFPNTGGFQGSLIGTQNMFIAAFDPSKSGTATKIYSIYIGGTRWDEAFGIAVAADGTIWLAGGTYSPDIWIMGSPYQGLYGGDGDAYIAHINPGLGANALLYASFLGGSGIDEATSMVLDPAGRVILSGYTLSANFPVTSTAFQTTYGGDTDAFVSIIDPSKSAQLVYSTYFGGPEPDAPMDLKQDSSGALYLCGYTQSPGLPSTSDALQAAYDDSVDAFALKLDPTKAGAAGIDYFSYLGTDGLQVAYGVDYDTKGNIYMVGSSSGAILAAHGGPERASIAGSVDGFVIGFSPGSSTPAAGSTASANPRKYRPWRVAPHR
ncbi:MAG: hypothetical protein JOZ32_02650 [Bryobacterales bacterium]|nr:hypothetical protein [Bryobacterales bacterium]